MTTLLTFFNCNTSLETHNWQGKAKLIKFTMFNRIDWAGLFSGQENSKHQHILLLLTKSFFYLVCTRFTGDVMDVERAPLTSKDSPRFSIRYKSAPVAFENEHSSRQESGFVRLGEWLHSCWKGKLIVNFSQLFFPTKSFFLRPLF